MIADLLGSWLRVRGSGRISDFRRRGIWLGRTADIKADSAECGRWLRDMSARGYVEVDWANDQWSCAPLVLTRLPRSDGVALLTGFASASARQRLAELEVESFTVPADLVTTNAMLTRPPALYVQYDAIEDLPAIASSLGAVFVPCAALQLAGSLLAPQLGSETAGPNLQNETLTYFTANELSFGPTSLPNLAPGLYRYEASGRRQYLWHEHGRWQRCALDSGVWFALRRAGTGAVRWRPYPGFDPATGPGQVFVDWGAALPDLHRRALVLCSGRTPRFADGAATAIYENVPRAVVEKTWATLSQRRQMI